MKKDIVERLRSLNDRWSDEAANEIVVLRASLQARDNKIKKLAGMILEARKMVKSARDEKRMPIWYVRADGFIEQVTREIARINLED